MQTIGSLTYLLTVNCAKGAIVQFYLYVFIFLTVRLVSFKSYFMNQFANTFSLFLGAIQKLFEFLIIPIISNNQLKILESGE